MQILGKHPVNKVISKLKEVMRKVLRTATKIKAIAFMICLHFPNLVNIFKSPNRSSCKACCSQREQTNSWTSCWKTSGMCEIQFLFVYQLTDLRFFLFFSFRLQQERPTMRLGALQKTGVLGETSLLLQAHFGVLLYFLVCVPESEQAEDAVWGQSSKVSEFDKKSNV